MNSLLQEFANFTREDWNAYESFKAKAFEPTQEELETQRLEQENNKKLVIETKLKALWITRPQIVTKEFVLWLLNIINAKEFVWNDVEKWVLNQIEVFWDLETAFDDLVYTRL